MSDSEVPGYTRYRARRGRRARPGDPVLPELAELRDASPLVGEKDVPQYRRYGAGAGGTLRRLPRLPGRRRGKPWTLGRAIRWTLAVLVAWGLLGVVAFVVSATLHQSSFDGLELDSGGMPPFTATNILVLGSDQRPKGSKEPGADNGVQRADSIMVLRVGGGKNAKLSIPRDTVVNIPNHGTNKINAAFAFGGVPLMVDTVRQYLGIKIDHVVQIDFTNFPKLIDAMGGVNYTGSCVVSKISGGYKNGGVTLRLKNGTTHIDGKQALALARTRHNDCNKREDDLARARRQQKLMTAIKNRALSPIGYLRGPFIGWRAPQAIKTDMAGPTLIGVASAMSVTPTAKPRVLKPSGAITLPDGGAGLQVSPASKRAAVRRFLG